MEEEKNKFLSFANNSFEVIELNSEKPEKLNQKKFNERFNSVTQKVKPENQNQTHNIRSEAVESKNRQV